MDNAAGRVSRLDVMRDTPELKPKSCIPPFEPRSHAQGFSEPLYVTLCRCFPFITFLTQFRPL